MRRSIEIEDLTHQNPIPAATRIGPLIESSIIAPFDPGTRNLPDTIEQQIGNLFHYMGEMLAAAGAGWNDMAKVTFFVLNAGDVRGAINEPWVQVFPDPASRPSRHSMTVTGDGPARVSCVFTAYVTDTEPGDA